jgi:two-component system cell cycle sensor histidine kinase/response regulator CckA
MVADVLREEVTTDAGRKMLELVRSSGQRGASMVKQILSFARGVGGGHTVQALAPLVAEMGKLAQDTFPRAIQIQTRIAPDLHPVKADATQIHQVLMNLCVNARDAMPAGGSLRIEAANILLNQKHTRMRPEPVSGPHVVLTVADSGHGIPAHLAEKIFEPFFTTKELGKGTGLGLSTVLGIVKTHNGFIEVTSETGQGTTFRVYLPADAANEIQPAAEAPAAPPMGHGEQVLLVDDAIALLEITRGLLGASNYRVLTASDGAEAVQLYRRHRGDIDAVVTDMMMPNLDGRATIRALREIDPGIKVVCISGLESELRVPVEGPLGVQATMKKPFTRETLLTTLHQVLAGEPLHS